MQALREEHDFLGVVKVPSDVHYGPSTGRMLDDLSSEISSDYWLAGSLALLKKASALSSPALGRKKASAIAAACSDVAKGRFDSSVVPALFSSSHSIHSHMSEIIANAALERSGASKGDYHLIHPVHDVGLGHTDDAIMEASARVSAVRLSAELLPRISSATAKMKKTAMALLSSSKDKSYAENLLSCRDGLAEAERQLRRSLEKLKLIPFSQPEVKLLKSETGINFRPGSASAKHLVELSSGLRLMSEEMLKAARIMAELGKPSELLPFYRVIGNDRIVLHLDSESALRDSSLVSLCTIQSMEHAINGLLRFERAMSREKPSQKEELFLRSVSPYLTHSFAVALAREARRRGVPLRQLLLRKKVVAPSELGRMFSGKFDAALSSAVQRRPAYRRMKKSLKV